MADYFDRAGKPITADVWAKSVGVLAGDNHIADDTVNDVRVSTVWLGIDHSFGWGPPLIFETMVFGGNNDQYMERYTTEAEAKEGHARILDAVRVGKVLD